jgi:glutathione S-transferase
MALTLYFHPLSSFCHKALIALYENDTAFAPRTVNFQDPAESEAFRKLWPVRKFPLLQDSNGDRIIAESSIIIEYLDQHYPGRTRFIPSDPDRARETRFYDRFFDLYIHLPLQQVIGDRLRIRSASRTRHPASAAPTISRKNS